MELGEPPRRYEALDSLRGICACMVVLYHLHPDGWLTSLAIARNGWMFVDFFFVLSGFVIAASYGEKLAAGYPITRFMGLRLGRIYPLHLFAIVVIAALNFIVTESPITPVDTLTSLFANLLMLQSFGVTEHPTWNGLSWSIAAEIWTYFSFALIVASTKRIDWRIFAGSAFAAWIVLIAVSDNYLATTWRFGFVRCVLGFSLGVLVWLAHRRWSQRSSTSVEVAAVLLTVVHVTMVGTNGLTFLAPAVFAILVFVMAGEGGGISRTLHARPLKFLGLLSYSIYLLHSIALARYFDLLSAVESFTGFRLITGANHHIAAGALITELLTIGALAFVIWMAWFAWRYVENPARLWSRQVFTQSRTALPIAAK